MTHAPCCMLTIDTEEEWPWEQGYSAEGGSLRNIQRLPAFQEVAERYGVKATYFVNYRVLNDPTARGVIKELAERPDVEIGMHIHPWNTPPITSPVASAKESFLHNLPEEIALAKLQTTYDAFIDAGLKPTSFRGGRYSTDARIQKFLSERGVWVDSSVVPYTAWTDDGAPDYLHAGHLPAFQAANGASKMCVLPLTRFPDRRPTERWGRLLGRIEGSPMARLRLIGLLEKCRIVKRVWLNVEHAEIGDLLVDLQTPAAASLPYWMFSLHSSDFLPGGSPYFKNDFEVRALVSALETLFSRLQAHDWVTVTQYAAQLRGR